MYFVLVIDIDTVFCFLLFYNITAPLKKKQYPMTDFQSFGSSAKLLSTYLIKLYRSRSLRGTLSGLLPYTNPSCIVLFKYKTTFFVACK